MFNIMCDALRAYYSTNEQGYYSLYLFVRESYYNESIPDFEGKEYYSELAQKLGYLI